MPAGVAALSGVWLVVALVGVATIAIKAPDPAVLGGRRPPPRVGAIVGLLAPAVLAALVVTQAVGGERALVLDKRLAGLAAAGLALRLRAPILVVIAVAALITALARSI